MKLIFTLMLTFIIGGYAMADSDDYRKKNKKYDDHHKYMNAEEIFKYLDTNGDKQLSLEEWIGFAMMDKNNDKLISLEEFKAHHNSKNHDEDHHHFFKRWFK